MKYRKYKIRKTELSQYKRVWLDEEGHQKLRKLKKKKKKSMAQTVKDLIIKKYNQAFPHEDDTKKQ